MYARHVRLALLATLPLAACHGRGADDVRESSASLSAVVIDSAAPAPDTRELARRLVTRSARIREGDLVFLTGGAGDLSLLEDLAIESRKTGAHALVTVHSDGLGRREYEEVPAKYDGRTDEMVRHLTGFLTAMFFIESDPTDTALAGIPPTRITSRIEAMQPVMELAQRRNIRRVTLGNGLYPTAERARLFGMTQAALADLFWKGVNVDYDALQATGEKVRSLLAGGREVRLTHPNGTDLTFRITGRPVFVSDGVISAEDERRGGAAANVWLPAGEVFLAPVRGSASGVVVADRYTWQGRTIERLRLEFREGKLTAMSAGSDMAALQAYYDAAPAGKEELGVLDVGINPNVAIPEGSTLAAWMPAGMVTLGLGANEWAGGTNHAVSGVVPFFPGTTLTVDGVELVKDGQLKLGTAVATRTH